MAPGSVNMRDADASEISEEYSDDSSSYQCSSDNDEYDGDLGLLGSQPTSTKDKPPYRIIDAELLKKVQVRRLWSSYIVSGTV